MSILHRRRKWRDYSDAKYARGEGVCRHTRQSEAVTVVSGPEVTLSAPAPVKRKKAAKKKVAKRRR